MKMVALRDKGVLIHSSGQSTASPDSRVAITKKGRMKRPKVEAWAQKQIKESVRAIRLRSEKKRFRGGKGGTCRQQQGVTLWRETGIKGDKKEGQRSGGEGRIICRGGGTGLLVTKKKPEIEEPLGIRTHRKKKKKKQNGKAGSSADG